MIKPLKVDDNRDRRLITTLEAVFGIKDYEQNFVSKGKTFFLRRSPREMAYSIWDGIRGPLGYLVIGEDDKGRIVMQAERKGEVIGKTHYPRPAAHVFLLAIDNAVMTDNLAAAVEHNNED